MSSRGNKNNGNNKTDAGDKGGTGKKTSTTGGGADGGLVPTNNVTTNLRGAWANGPPQAAWTDGDVVRASKHIGLGPSSDDGKSEVDSERDVDSTTAKTKTSIKRKKKESSDSSNEGSEVGSTPKRHKKRRSPRTKKGKRNFGSKTTGMTKEALDACGGNDSESEAESEDTSSKKPSYQVGKKKASATEYVSDSSSSDSSSSDSSYNEDDNKDGEVIPTKKETESDDSGSESDAAQNKAVEEEQPGETVAAAAAVPPVVLIGGAPPAVPDAGADPAADLTNALALLPPGSVVIQGPIEHNNIRGWFLEAVRLLADQEAVPVASGKALYAQLVKYIGGNHVRSDGRLNKSFLEGLRDSGSTMAEWAYLDDATRRVQKLVDQATTEAKRRAEQSGQSMRKPLVKYGVPDIDKLVKDHVEKQMPLRLAAAFAKVASKLKEVENYLRLNGVTEKYCTDGKHWRARWDDADRGNGGAGGAGMAA